MPRSKYAAYAANVNIVAIKRIRKDKARIDLGKIRNANKTRVRTATINRIKATTDRPADAVEQPVQYKPQLPPHLGVANEITQNRADRAVIPAVIISSIVSVICMSSTRLLLLLLSLFSL